MFLLRTQGSPRRRSGPTRRRGPEPCTTAPHTAHPGPRRHGSIAAAPAMQPPAICSSHLPDPEALRLPETQEGKPIARLRSCALKIMAGPENLEGAPAEERMQHVLLAPRGIGANEILR